MDSDLKDDLTCDVVVVGSGAGGLSTAITASKLGLDVVVIEKEGVFGGTTAFSGGVLWIPGNTLCDAEDSVDAARTYLKGETGNFYDAAAVNAFLQRGPEMLDFFQRETSVKFVPTLYPDYHPDALGGVDVGRSVLAAPFDTSALGHNLKRLRPPLSTITFMGMMFNSSNADIKHFFNATKSVISAAYVAKRLLSHFWEIVRFGRGTNVTSGNALAARLAKSAFDLDIPIHTSTRAKKLLSEKGKVTGALVEADGKDITINARKGVVLAAGGFAHDLKRIGAAYPHLKSGGEHFSPVPESNTGDGIELGEEAGGKFNLRYPNTSAWMPVSKVPIGGGKFKAFPHLLDRYKPGIIAVLKNGKRFTNESESYHDVGAALIAACAGEKETACWLICDYPTIRKYGLGYAKPAPVPLSTYLRNGYLKSGKTLADLAGACGISTEGLNETIASFNKDARKGKDPAFRRGTTSFNRYLADPEHLPNPCVGPIEKGPYFALKIIVGDLGTFDGLETTVEGQVLNKDGKPIDGLYAVGNDRASIMGGNYPGAGITLGPAMTFGYITGRHLAGAD
ncbi:FAD-dependent oxidoreductase [Mariluticola halotolerans]|uniref:FAD-dependent oxidoreductase n=1 Tax=Mariluticola halotolerans TaxID=2909283 RepID=UPI0026E42A8C|nr:FAD-dependent oxidoreductase [Mariluticola halotolerans]UJQ94118.1 FAD-dependent oxidoreductase [Mariluticola halotolerans]